MNRNEKKQSTGNAATDRSKRPAVVRPALPNMQFLTVVLSDADKSACLHWSNSNPPIWEIVDGFISEGYKLSFGCDQRTGAIMCTLTDKRPDSQFLDHCFTIRGRDTGTALFRVCWVHAVRADGDWSEIAKPSDVGDVW